jgi:succinate dehydrogenase / fumarate reductase cytochrome b subunit
MLGNLQVMPFLGGREALNKYAEFLHSLPGLLWVARLTLLAAVGAHIWAAVSLTNQNRKARPNRYHVKHSAATTYAAKTMIFGGLIIALFLVYHLAHLTLGLVGPGDMTAKHDGRIDLFSRVVLGFQNPAISGLYILANLALGLHLFHGVWSMLQTLGANHRKYNALRKALAAGVAVVVAGGNIAIPVAVMAGIVSF